MDAASQGGFFAQLLSSDLLARGHCYQWRKEIVWLHASSDALMGLAFLVIPILIALAARRRPDLPFRWMFLCFGGVVLACGATHLMEVWTIWHGTYRLSGLLKAVTAVGAAAAAGASLWVLPRLSHLPSPRQLEAMNLRLQQEITEREAVGGALADSRAQLERRVEQRTAELERINQALQRQIDERARAEARFHAVVEAAPNAMLLVGGNGEIRLVNAQAEHVFGYRRAELLGQAVEKLIPMRLRESHQADRLRFVAAPRARTMGTGRDLTCRRKDGTEVPVEVGLGPVQTPEGPMVLASIVDITERRRNEELVGARTRELETLLYVTSHDLREPLRAIQNFSSMVQKDYAAALDERGRDLLLRIERAGHRLQQLLDDLLALSRARRIPAVDHVVAGRAVVEDALERLASVVRATRAQVTVGEDLPDIRADRTWATQALYNLLSNALKFVREGEPPQVEIAGYRQATGPNAGVGIAVRDRGPGVELAHAERIFELFQRGVGREVEGTGAGLAIVREVAVRSGGRAWVQPRAGGGSEFIICFGPGGRLEEDGPDGA